MLLIADYKNSCGVGPNSMHELAYNATSIVWDPANQPIKVSNHVCHGVLRGKLILCSVV
jgi:hypothetical protein